MAKFTTGPAVAAVSGSVGGNTFSRNRYGQYIRFRAKPTVSTTPDAQNAKGILANLTTNWQTLTDAQRAAWANYANTHLVRDSLGIPQALTGHQTYVGINARIDRDGGTLLTDPPASAAPDGLTSLTLAADIGAGNVDLTFAPSPLAADDKLWIRAAVVNSPGINYVENLLRLIQISSAAATTPEDIETALAAKFGTLQVGQKVVVDVAVYDSVTGLISGSLRDSAIIVTT